MSTQKGGVVILSLILAGFFLPPLLRGQQMPDEGAEARDERRARQIASVKAIKAIEQLQSERFVSREHERSALELDWLDTAAHISAEYRDRLSRAESSEDEAEHRHAVAGMERTIAGQALAAERSTYFRLAREISDALARRLVSEVDQREVRMRASAAAH